MEELSIPPGVTHASRAMEIARVWIVDKKLQVVLSANLWNDPAAWGLMLVDLVRQVANVYEAQGRDRAEVLRRIKSAFEAEWDTPTNEPEQVE